MTVDRRPTTIAIAAPYIADPHPRVRLGVARLLLLSRDPAAMGLVLTRLFDQDPAVRSLARHPERPSEL